MKNRNSKHKCKFTDEDFLPSLNAQKEYILKHFDFDYVREVLTVPSIYKNPITGERTAWTIYNGRMDTLELPTIETLKDMASVLLMGAIKCQDSVYVGRYGPFRVIKTDNRLILDCILTTCSYD